MLLLLLSHLSCVQICVTPQTAAHQAPLPLGFSRQEYWSGWPLIRWYSINRWYFDPNPHRPLGWNPFWKNVACTCWKGPRAGQVRKKKPDNWPKISQDLEELSYINGLPVSSLHSSSFRGTPTLSLPGMYFCLACILTNRFSGCSPTCCSCR